MQATAIPPTVLLVLGILMLIKSVFAIAKPMAFRRLAAWWSGAAMKVNTLSGVLCILLAAFIWAAVLMRQPLTNWLLLAIGVLFAWGASLYFRPAALQRVIRVAILDRPASMIRVMFFITAVIAGVLIWVAVRSFPAS